MKGWRWTFIRIRDKAYRFQTVKAYTNGILAIHHTPLRGCKKFAKGYTVTHVVTGGEINAHLRFSDAKTLARALSALDWSVLKSGKDKETLVKLYPDVARIRRECGVFQ